MLNFTEYSLISENFNQMKSLVAKNNSGADFNTAVINNSDVLNLLKTIIGVDSTYTKICTDTKIIEMYGDIPGFSINEQKERSMRPYLGMFAKMFYDEKCPLDIILYIVHYILENKATINKLVVKNNSNGDTQVLSNMLDIFKFKDSINSVDKRPAYEIITDAIRDKDKSKNVTDFINKMPGTLKTFFRDEEYYKEISDLINSYESLDISIRQSIYHTFFGSGDRTGKISRYKNADDFLADFKTLISNGSDFNIDVIKNEILNTRGAKLIECNYEKNYIIADIWNYNASNSIGEPSNWCISYNDTSEYWYNTYMRLEYERKMFFIWNFNLEQTNPLSKLGANLNSDGSVNMVCDKNDKSIYQDQFITYLDKYEINKQFISLKISKEEMRFKKADLELRKYTTNKIFEDLTRENYKTELAKILRLTNENGFDISEHTIYDGLCEIAYMFTTEEILDIINILLDGLGNIKKYSNLFTHTIDILSQKQVNENDLVLINNLYVRLNKKINYGLLNKYNYSKLKTTIPFIYDITQKYLLENFFLEPSTYNELFFHTVEYGTLDDNFDKLFAIENIIDYATTIYNIILGKQTKNNFLQKLNDISFNMQRYGHVSLPRIVKTTGFFDTHYSFNVNYDDVLTALLNVVDDVNYNKNFFDKENFKKILTINADLLKRTLQDWTAINYLCKVVKLYQLCDMDISPIEFETRLETKQDVDVVSRIVDINTLLYLVTSGKIRIYDTAVTHFVKFLYSIPNCYENNTLYIYKLLNTNVFNYITTSGRFVDLEKDEITSNIELSKKLLENDIFSLYMLYNYIRYSGDLVELATNKIIEHASHFGEQNIIDMFFKTDIPTSVKEYLIKNIDFSDSYISRYINDIDDILLLYKNNIAVDNKILTYIFNDGMFTEYNKESIDLIDKLSVGDYTYSKNDYSQSYFYLNDINIIKHFIQKNPSSAGTMGRSWKSSASILETNDIEKIKFFGELGMNYSPISELSFRYADHNKTNLYTKDTILFLIQNNKKMDEHDMIKVFRLMKDAETFAYFYNKFKNQLSQSMLYDIINDILIASKFQNAISVLEYFKTEIPENMRDIVMENYEENKRKKVYTEEVREWIKQTYYTKAKVKKIREMYSIFNIL